MRRKSAKARTSGRAPAAGRKKEIVAPRRRKSKLSAARAKAGRRRKGSEPRIRKADSDPALEPNRRARATVRAAAPTPKRKTKKTTQPAAEPIKRLEKPAKAKASSQRVPVQEPIKRLKKTKKKKKKQQQARAPKQVISEETLSSSMEEALGWMAGVDAKKRIGPARSDTRRISRDEARRVKSRRVPRVEEPAPVKATKKTRKKKTKKRAQTGRIERPRGEGQNAFAWMDELAGPFPDDLELSPVDKNQRRRQPTPEPRKIPATTKGETRRLSRDAKTRTPTRKVARPVARPQPQEPRRAPTQRVPRQPQPEVRREPKRPTGWGAASSGVTQKLPPRRPTQRIGPPVDRAEHLADRPPTAELSDSEIRMLGLPPEIALQQPRPRARQPQPRPPVTQQRPPVTQRPPVQQRPPIQQPPRSSVQQPGPAVQQQRPPIQQPPRSSVQLQRAPVRPVESLDEPLERTLSRLANQLDPDRPSVDALVDALPPPPHRRPQAARLRRRPLEISDAGPVIVDPAEVPFEPFASPGLAVSEAPTRRGLPAVSPLESSPWDEPSSQQGCALPFPALDDPFADDPFANDPFVADPFAEQLTDPRFDLDDPYLLAAIDPTGSSPFDDDVLKTDSGRDLFPDPPEYQSPGCGDPFCVDPSCGGDPFAFQVRAAEHDPNPLPPVTDRRPRRLRRGA